MSPAEIEAVLLEHSDIFDAAVIGIPDDEAGEVPKAFVVRKQGSRVSEEDIIQFIQSMFIYWHAYIQSNSWIHLLIDSRLK